MQKILAILVLVSLVPCMAQYNMLPQSTAMVVTMQSVQNFLGKFNMENHGQILAMVQSMTSGMFDVTNPKEYLQRGIDPKRPMGIAALDETSQFFVAFIPINDGAEFRKFLDTQASPKNTAPCKAGGVYRWVGTANSVAAVHYVNKGYWFIFGTTNPNLRSKKKFLPAIDTVLSSSKKLSEFSTFQECEKCLTGNLFIYMDYAKIIGNSMKQAMNVLPEDQKAAVAKMQKVLQDFSCIGIDVNWQKELLTFSYYIGLKEGSPLIDFYKSNENCADILGQMPPSPLACAVGIGSFEKAWDFNKEYINSTLSMLPIPPEFQSLDKIFKTAEDVLKQEMNLKISLEQDIIKNIQGNSVFALYTLPTNENMSVDLAILAKLNNSEKMATILSDLVARVQKKDPKAPVIVEKTEDCTYYSIDLKGIIPNSSIAPTLGVYDDYLLMTSTKPMLKKIVDGQEGFFASVRSKEIVDGMKNGIASVGFIKVQEISQRVLEAFPMPEVQYVHLFTKHFPEIRWTGKLAKNGLVGNFILEADDDIVKIVLQEVENLQNMMMGGSSQGEQTHCDCDNCLEEDCPCQGMCNPDCNCNCDKE